MTARGKGAKTKYNACDCFFNLPAYKTCFRNTPIADMAPFRIFTFSRICLKCTYHQDNVGSLRSFQCPFAVGELSVVSTVSRTLNLTSDIMRFKVQYLRFKL